MHLNPKFSSQSVFESRPGSDSWLRYSRCLSNFSCVKFFDILSWRLNKAPKWPQEHPGWLQGAHFWCLQGCHPASVKKAISSQILSLHRYRCWPTRLCHPNGPGWGGVSITLAAMYLQGLRTQPALVQPVNTKVRQIHSSLGCE